MQARCAVEHRPRPDRIGEGRAQVRLAVTAVVAVTARRSPVQHDVIAGLDAGHARADRFDHARTFMPAHDGQRVTGRPGDEVIIAVAHAARGDPHTHFARLRVVERQGFKDKWGIGGVQNGGLYLHEGLL